MILKRYIEIFNKNILLVEEYYFVILDIIRDITNKEKF